MHPEAPIAVHGEPTLVTAAGNGEAEVLAPPAPLPPLVALAREVLELTLARFMSAGRQASADPTGVEAVHDLRVSSRRFREALRLFRPLLAKGSARLGRRLRKLRRALGEMRNREVTIARLTRMLPDSPPAAALVLEALRARLELEVAADRDRLPKRMESLHLARFEEQSREVIAALLAPSNGQEVPTPRAFVQRALLRQQQAVLEAEARLEGTRAPSSRRLHQLRIALKKLRYQAECLEPLGLASLPQVLTELKPRQDLLGEIQDAEVLRGMLDRRRQKAERGARTRKERALVVALSMVEQRREALYGAFSTVQAERKSSALSAPVEEELRLVR